jgi:uncharacterized protein (TIGR01777 family)
MQKVVIAGGTGSVGLALAKHMQSQGYEIILLTRRIRENLPYQQILWDGKTVDAAWAQHLAGSILVNLAGELVDRVPTRKNIELLTNSRVEPTLTLARATAEFGLVKLCLQMSTLASYGDAGDQVLTEKSPPASGSRRVAPPQMVGVAKAWESAATGIQAERIAVLRCAVILQPNTPALDRLVTITKWFMGSTVGSGKQLVSFIHEDDFLRAIDFVINHREISGVVHTSSPQPISNRGMMATLRKQLRRPNLPATPAWVIVLGARFIFKTDAALALTGRRAIPKKLLDSGFIFEHPDFDDALRVLLQEGNYRK